MCTHTYADTSAPQAWWLTLLKKRPWNRHFAPRHTDSVTDLSLLHGLHTLLLVNGPSLRYCLPPAHIIFPPHHFLGPISEVIPCSAWIKGNESLFDFWCRVPLLCPAAGYHVSLNMSHFSYLQCVWRKTEKKNEYSAMWQGPPAPSWQENHVLVRFDTTRHRALV